MCSDIPAFREVGGNACHYFDLHAESALSAVMIAAICKALTGPAGSVEGLERFSAEHIAGEYAALYAHLTEDASEGADK